MTTTYQLKCALTTKVIKQHQASRIKRLNDSQSRLYFTYHGQRRTGTFHFVKRVNRQLVWRKLGHYPILSVAEAKNMAFELEKTYYQKHAEGIELNQLSSIRAKTVTELLTWFLKHKQQQYGLSQATKTSIRNSVQTHLLPCLASLSVKELNRAHINQLLITPLLGKLSPSTVHKIFQHLKQACQLAFSAGVINHPVLEGVQFANFTTSKIKAKPSRLSTNQLEQVLADIHAAPHTIQQIMLTMLLFGTRLGETCKMRWHDVNIRNKKWYIPAEHTKTKQAHQLPITDVAEEVFESFRLQHKYRKQQKLWCFASSSHAKDHIDINLAGKQVSYHAKQGYSSHDLRKLMRTNLTELGIDHFIGEQLINHKLSALNSAYIFTHAEQQKYQALLKWHQHLLPLGLEAILKDRRKLVRHLADRNNA
ncbi:site-specific integrase [Pseudoalteromonas tunicata]|uniref:site-specific integrase n=1 Tax=Pseudoalteromonas tunicata TaxID=314281 RepID=UPI00273E6CD5|nr:site-specific integrase [Pseudoalteromonas tunicata]MDP4984432.1 tyrosine-type recombinase/integrase [Pseudoalteromonas tunicata]